MKDEVSSGEVPRDLAEHASIGEIRRALALLAEPGAVAELRVPGSPRGTTSGYFNDPEKLARAAVAWSGQAPGIYVTLNPVNPELIARARNRVKGYAKHTTADGDVLRRRWFGLDFDPVRPAGISATEAEHTAALTRAAEVRESLRAEGWPEPIFGDSGNGAHLLYSVELPNDDASRTLLSRCLEALAFRFSDDAVSVDLTTFNASRIWKVYGTLAAKGDDTPERPHRLARLLDVPQRPEPVALTLLESLAACLPSRPPDVGPKSDGAAGAAFDLEAWLAQHADRLQVVMAGPWKGWPAVGPEPLSVEPRAHERRSVCRPARQRCHCGRVPSQRMRRQGLACAPGLGGAGAGSRAARDASALPEG